MGCLALTPGHEHPHQDNAKVEPDHECGTNGDHCPRHIRVLQIVLAWIRRYEKIARRMPNVIIHIAAECSGVQREWYRVS